MHTHVKIMSGGQGIEGIGDGGLCCIITQLVVPVYASTYSGSAPTISDLLCHSHIFWCQPSKILEVTKSRFAPGLGFGLAPGLC